MIAMLSGGAKSQNPGMLKRWFVFNIVGGLGVVVQLTALIWFTGWLGLNYLFGTALAVEAAVLHNFVWHERGRGPSAHGVGFPGVWGGCCVFICRTACCP
jgi:hypothetical protein